MLTVNEIAKRRSKEGVNLASLVVGIIFIVLGLAGSAITITQIIFLVIGTILALMGGLTDSKILNISN